MDVKKPPFPRGLGPITAESAVGPESSQLAGHGRQGAVLRANHLASGIRKATAPTLCRPCQGQVLAKKPSLIQALSRERLQRPSPATLVSSDTEPRQQSPNPRADSLPPEVPRNLDLGIPNYGGRSETRHCSNCYSENPPKRADKTEIAASSWGIRLSENWAT